MSYARPGGEQLHPDELRGQPELDGTQALYDSELEDWQLIGLAVMHDRSLPPDERTRLAILVTEHLRGVSE